MLTCKSCQLLLADALYEDIDEVRHQQLQAHLARCDDCLALQQELHEARELLPADQTRSHLPEHQHDLGATEVAHQFGTDTGLGQLR